MLRLHKCGICCLDLKKEECVLSPCCQELFHKNCVVEWIRRNPNGLCFICAKKRLTGVGDFISFERILNKLSSDEKTPEQEIQDFIENLAKRNQSLSIVSFKTEFSSAIGRFPTLGEINEFLKLDSLYHKPLSPPPKEKQPNFAELLSSLLSHVHVDMTGLDTSSLSSSSSSISVSSEQDIDITGLNEDDINIVVAEAGVSRAVAVAALQASNGDFVTAILSLAGDSSSASFSATSSPPSESLTQDEHRNGQTTTNTTTTTTATAVVSTVEVNVDPDVADIVAMEAGVTKAEAVAALRANGNDYTKAIMALYLDVN